MSNNLISLKRLSLFKKLSISAFIVFIVLILGFFWISQAIERVSRAQAEQELHKDLAKHLVHDNPLLYSENLNSDNIGNLFHAMMILGANFEFYVLDNKGKILNYSAKPGEVLKQKINLSPIKDFLEGKLQFPIFAEDPRGEDNKIFSVARISKKNKNVGYLYIIVRSKIYDGIYSRLQNNQRLRTILLVSIISTIFLFALIFLSFHFFVQPLNRLTRAINAMKRDGFDEKLPNIKVSQSGTEIDILTDAFNQMITQINQQFEQLKSVDSERRELLTHLSHDLRTPLASLQGFLETIAIKNEQIEPTKRLEYINRSLKNAQRLKLFVDQIFELAHLESGHVKVNLESFPIGELLYDLKEKFNIKATRKNISLKVHLDDEKIECNTDIAKLERVVSNLIDNAIRHTPEEGTIEIILRKASMNDQFTVLIKDSGSGIPEDEMAYLFDARYRGTQTAEDGEKHIGLGLTISQKLLAVLNSEIKVENNPDGGACFSFNLLAEV